MGLENDLFLFENPEILSTPGWLYTYIDIHIHICTPCLRFYPLGCQSRPSAPVAATSAAGPGPASARQPERRARLYVYVYIRIYNIWAPLKEI